MHLQTRNKQRVDSFKALSVWKKKRAGPGIDAGPGTDAGPGADPDAGPGPDVGPGADPHTFFLQNVKLLQQFISPHTGLVYDPTRTGKKWVCLGGECTAPADPSLHRCVSEAAEEAGRGDSYSTESW